MFDPVPDAASDRPELTASQRGRIANWWAVLGLFLAVGLIYGRYLPKDHFTASGDFPPAVSYALNFRLAVEQGQWAPRMITIPRDVSLGLGSRDGTPQTADSPVFQYYSFGQSALAYPFLRLGLPGIKAVQCVVVLAFSLSALALYAAGRLVGATRPIAFLGAFSYVISPWLVSNFYGRGGIAEAVGQAGLAFPVLAFACFLSGRRWGAVVVMAAGIGWLALSHNIFLLYGIVMCVLFAGGLLLFPLGGEKSWAARFRAPLVLGTGVALGLAATAWQWLPAAQSLGEIGFSYIGAFDETGRIPKAYSDWSGALGMPKQFVEPWSGKPREFFFTIGWWTIPGIVLLCRVPRALRPQAITVAATFAVFLALILFPKQIYPFLPGPFGATQFNFRLLSFLSVLGTLAVFLAVPRLNGWIVIAVLALITASQFKVITFPMPAGGGITPLHEEQYVRGSEYSDFYPNSPAERRLRYFYDGQLDAANVLNLHQRFWRENDRRVVEDIANPATPVYLHLRGKLADGLPQTKLRLVTADDSARVVSDAVEVHAGDRFDVTLVTTAVRSELRLVADPTVTNGKRQLSIRPEEVFASWGNPRSLVAAAELQVISRRGFQRTFAVEPAAQAQSVADPSGSFTVEIPMIYSRFLQARQNGRLLPTAVDFNHRLNVRVTELSGPITVTYRLPPVAWGLTAAGLLGTIVCTGLALRPAPTGNKDRPAAVTS